ncbi:MAG TPA: heparinase II/III family protein [Telluria sp.]|nr:heparinase II/III family protein [Telluria sp.]
MTIRPRRAALILALLCAGHAHADWVVSTRVEATRPAPDNFQVQAQNPPAFSWSQHRTLPATYVVEIRQGSTVVQTVTVDNNFYLPSARLANGHYSWRVRPGNSTEWSNLREFDITSASTVFEVPANSALRTYVATKSRQIARHLPDNFLRVSQWSAAMRAEREPALKLMMNEVQYRSVKPPVDSDWPFTTINGVTAITTAQASDIRQRVFATARQLEQAALLYRLTLDRKYLTEAVTRGDQLAALSPTGPTAYKYQDQATRQIALSLLKGADMLYYDMDPAKRLFWWDRVRVRGQDIYLSMKNAPNSIFQFPFDSHGGTNLGYLAVISSLALGNIKEAGLWFDFSTRPYINSVYAWSGPEGGYSNGTAYAQYTADYALQLWQPLMQMTGVNMFDKPWSRGFMQYFAHFTPPGTTRHLFGDEHETKPDYRMMKAYARRFASPYAAWYGNAIAGEEDTLTLLQAPYPLPSATVTPAAPPNAALYPSIGWVAMHSNLANNARTSVYFKSSPYGAYNHSHGDQNSFVLSSGGRELLIEAGYLDYYNSPLFKDWYRQTKAHNAVTFDGGIGQLVTGNTENLARNGKVTAFSTTPALDFTEGDAAAAYGSAVTTAKRKLWYLRNQDAVVIQDKMSAPVAHRWEWNMHAVAPIVSASDGSVSITNVDRKVCIRQLLSDAITPMNYEVRTGPAAKAGGPVETHGAFVTPSKTSAEFLMLLDVGCKRPNVTMTETSTSRTFVIGSQSVTVPK